MNKKGKKENLKKKIDLIIKIIQKEMNIKYKGEKKRNNNIIDDKIKKKDKKRK